MTVKHVADLIACLDLSGTFGDDNAEVFLRGCGPVRVGHLRRLVADLRPHYADWTILFRRGR